jgi:cyclopropane fatty-acyl-phospholipid synthase-like methyltransferase
MLVLKFVYSFIVLTYMDKFTILKQSEERDYNEYVTLMDASVNQKINDMFKHIIFIPNTIILDLGCGSGLLTYHLAQLYPHNKVIGVDICENLVKQANDKYKLSNLEFIQSPLNTIQFSNVSNIILSSVLHEVYSYSTHETHHDKLQTVYDFISHIYTFLVQFGKIIIRDFIRPENETDIVMFEHQHSDHNINTEFTNFIKLIQATNKSYSSNIHGLLLEYKKNGNMYLTNMETFYEYIFRKDYHVNWKEELNERYGFWNIHEVEHLRSLLKGTIKTTFLDNEWILNNRIKGKIVCDIIPHYQLLVVISAN